MDSFSPPPPLPCEAWVKSRSASASAEGSGAENEVSGHGGHANVNKEVMRRKRCVRREKKNAHELLNETRRCTQAYARERLGVNMRALNTNVHNYAYKTNPLTGKLPARKKKKKTRTFSCKLTHINPWHVSLFPKRTPTPHLTHIPRCILAYKTHTYIDSKHVFG